MSGSSEEASGTWSRLRTEETVVAAAVAVVVAAAVFAPAAGRDSAVAV